MKKGGRSLLESVLEYVNLLLKHKLMIVIITTLAGIGVVIFAYISIKLPPDQSPLPNFYRANALVMIEEQGQNGVESLYYALGIGPQIRSSGADNTSMIASRILTTRTFLNKIVEEFDIPHKYEFSKQNSVKYRQEVLRRTNFSYDRNSLTMVFSYEDNDPTFARDILNRMIELLIDWFSTEGSATKLSQKGLLEKKLAELSLTISGLEESIQAFQRKHKVLSVEEIATIQTEILSNLRSQLILKEMEIKNYSEFSRIADSVSIRLKAERNNIIETIQQVENGYSSEGNTMPSRDELPKLFQEFNDLSTDLQIQRRIYETLSQQYEVAKLTLETTPVYRVLEWAEIPEEKAGPARAQICVIVVVGAFFFSCFLIIVIDFLKSFKVVPKKVKNVP